MAQRGSIDPLVRTTTLQVLQAYGVEARDDDGELHAIYEAVKVGHPNVPALKNGFPYRNDPRYADYFTAPADSLRACLKGAPGGDCDDATLLIGAMLGSIGWRVGMRGWGEDNAPGMIHVYPVAAYPKRAVPAGTAGFGQAVYTRTVGLDATVPEAYVGWEPPRSSNVLTAWGE